jgi:ribA/ribD-fused uncharacterized protein
MKEGVNFVESRWHYLSPFSAHEIEIGGVIYKTAEHAYQTLRMLPDAQEKIRSAKSPLDAWRLAQKCKREELLNSAVSKDDLMEQIFRTKLDQHLDIKEILLESGDAELLKVHDSDYYWGTGADGTGDNRMGKLWMKLRDELQ